MRAVPILRTMEGIMDRTGMDRVSSSTRDLITITLTEDTIDTANMLSGHCRIASAMRDGIGFQFGCETSKDQETWKDWKLQKLGRG